MYRSKNLVFILAFILMPAAAQNKAFTVTFQSAIEPIVINQIHQWEILVLTNAGVPVTNADITVDGGMPAHNHGLPTAPKVTENLGDGRYRVEGLRFHMSGYWEIRFTIKAGGKEDTATVTLEL